MIDKQNINIRIFGESQSGKTHFYSGMLETFCFSRGVFNDSHTTLYSMETLGDLSADSIGIAKEIRDHYKYKGDIDSTNGVDREDLVFKLVGEGEYEWPVVFYDYKGGNVIVDSEDDLQIQAQEIEQIMDGDVLYILVDAVALAKCLHKCEERVEKPEEYSEILNKEENITYCRNMMGMDKYAMILQKLLQNMKQKHLTIAFLLTKTDSREFDSSSNIYADKNFSLLREAVQKMYEKEIFAIRKHEKWNCGIFPIGVFGKGNVTDEEKALNEKSLHPEGIARTLMYSLYGVFDGIERSLSESMSMNDESIKDIKFADCTNFLSALRIDPKAAGNWKQLKNNYFVLKEKNEELKAQRDEIKIIMKNIKADFEDKYNGFIFKSTALLPKEGVDITPKNRKVE